MVLKKRWIGEDWLSLVLGQVIFAISAGAFQGNHLLGWEKKTRVLVEAGKAISRFIKIQGSERRSCHH